MKIDDARKILAVQAIEQSDPGGEILTDEDRREAGAIAGAPLSRDASTAEEDAFLAERSEILLVRIASRLPKGAEWTRRSPDRHRYGWLVAGLCLAATVAGYLTSELGPEKRINILSFPLLGILAWSLLVYLREIVLFFRKRERLFHDGLIDGLIRLLQRPHGTASPPRGNGETPDKLESAETVFEGRWVRLTAPIYGARIKAMLHSVALLLAASAVAGMYVNGLANEYRAVWESTFFTDSESLRPFLQAVLGPAASLAGDSIPSPEELDRIHWRADGEAVAGENAADWIHWYAITIGLFVIVPRFVLATLWKWRASRLAHTLPFREVSPGYFDHLLSTSSGTSLEISILPYALPVDDDLRRRIQDALERRFERPVHLAWLPSIAFGEEEDLPDLGEDFEGILLPLFLFSSTPEKETHLDLLRTLSERAPVPIELLLLDASAFDRKSESFPDAVKRRADREAAWNYLLANTGIEPVLVTTHDAPAVSTAD